MATAPPIDLDRVLEAMSGGEEPMMQRVLDADLAGMRMAPTSSASTVI